MRPGRRSRGFTLMELIISLAIAAVLSLTVMGLFSTVTENFFFNKTNVELTREANKAVFGSGTMPGILRDLREASGIDTSLHALDAATLSLRVRGETLPVRYLLQADSTLLRQKVTYHLSGGNAVIDATEDEIAAREVANFSLSFFEKNAAGLLVASAGSDSTALVHASLEFARGKRRFALATSGGFRR